VLEPLEEGGSSSKLDGCITGGNSFITVGAVGAIDGRGFLSGGGSTHGRGEDFDVGCNGAGARGSFAGGGNGGEYGGVPGGFTRTHGGG